MKKMFLMVMAAMGTKVAMVVICYDKEHEAQLGGDVAKHVFESIKFQ